MNRSVTMSIVFLFVVALAAPAFAQGAETSRVLFTNVNVWDGTSDGLASGQSVLVEGNLIKQVGANISAPGDATVIDGGGRSPMMNPYKQGPLGVIQAGAYADLLIVDGNPLEDILLLVEPEKNLSVIMKDGKIYKNTLN